MNFALRTSLGLARDESFKDGKATSMLFFQRIINISGLTDDLCTSRDFCPARSLKQSSVR